MNPCFAVLLHIAAPSTWPGCRRVIEAVKEVAAVPITLLLVPRYRGEDHNECMQLWQPMAASAAIVAGRWKGVPHPTSNVV